MNELDWTEKYRPKLLKDVLGNAKAVSELKRWADSWVNNKPVKKAVILAGPAGTGKTSSATALANQYGWSLIELNASDARNMAKIKSVATTGALNQTFTVDGQYLLSKSGGRKLIVLDEADSLYEGSASAGGPEKKDMSDRGGKRAIVDTVENAQQPIILIVNDLYGLLKGSGAALRNSTITIKFFKLKEATIQQALRSIAEIEKVRLGPEVIETIARRSEGDLRAAINDFQSLAIGRDVVSMELVTSVGGRDMKLSIFDAVRDVFRGTSTSRIRNSFLNVDETPENILLWIDENLPFEYRRPEDLVNGFNMLSRADVFLGRVRRRQHYKFQGYSKDLMTAGVASVKQHTYSGWTKYNFPSWLKKMSVSKESRALYKGLSIKIGMYNHVSSKTVRSELILYFKQLFKADNEFAVNMITGLEFDRDEIALLLNEKPGSNRVKSLLEEVKRFVEIQQAGDSPTASRTQEAEDAIWSKKGPEKKKKKEGAAGKTKDSDSKEKKDDKSKKKDGRGGKKAGSGSSGKESEKEEEDQEADAESETGKKKEVQKSLFDF